MENSKNNSKDKLIKSSKKILKKLLPLLIVIVGVFMFRTKYMISYVPTESMEPYIMRGSIVISDKNYDDYKVGDVAIYDSDMYGMKIIHRIINVENGKYQFKGDNNEYPDDNLVSKDNIISKYVWHSTTLGKIYKNGSQIIFLLSLICFIFYMFFDRIVVLIKKVGRKNNDV